MWRDDQPAGAVGGRVAFDKTFAPVSVTRYGERWDELRECTVTAPAERMKAMRNRRRTRGLREVRLTVPDARAPSVRERVALQVARLHPEEESSALRWIEAVSEFDGSGAMDDHETG